MYHSQNTLQSWMTFIFFINLFIFQSRLPILWQYRTSLRRFTNKIIIESKYFSLDGDCSVFCIFRKTWQHIIWKVFAKVPSPFYSLNLHWWFLVECWRLMSLECWAKLEETAYCHTCPREGPFLFPPLFLSPLPQCERLPASKLALQHLN